jgi:transposase
MEIGQVPAYHPADLHKLFIYGYLNKIRFSRDLWADLSGDSR